MMQFDVSTERTGCPLIGLNVGCRGIADASTRLRQQHVSWPGAISPFRLDHSRLVITDLVNFQSFADDECGQAQNAL